MRNEQAERSRAAHRGPTFPARGSTRRESAARRTAARSTGLRSATARRFGRRVTGAELRSSSHSASALGAAEAGGIPNPRASSRTISRTRGTATPRCSSARCRSRSRSNPKDPTPHTTQATRRVKPLPRPRAGAPLRALPLTFGAGRGLGVVRAGRGLLGRRGTTTIPGFRALRFHEAGVLPSDLDASRARSGSRPRRGGGRGRVVTLGLDERTGRDDSLR